MSLSPEMVIAVRRSFAQIRPMADLAATLFYDRLFAIAPEVRPLFPEDMEPQGARLMQSIGLVVASLDHPEALAPQLRELGARHLDYGAEEAHYPIVESALLWALREGLQDDFTTPVEVAWQAAVRTVSTLMIEGARTREATHPLNGAG
ncbi:MAG: globin family protein [Myxococcota bacterium]